MKPVRVLIVDDSAMMRSFLRETLSADPGIEVVGAAADPYMAREQIKQLDPDVLTLDIEMPGMDGITFLENLMRLRPMRVVMVSSLTQRGASFALKALEMGAIDFIGKPREPLGSAWGAFTIEITAIVKNAARASVPYVVPAPLPVVAKPGLPASGRVVALGGSTGSVAVFQHIISSLPVTAPAIVLAIHMPPMFTKHFAARLDSICALKVEEAVNGAPLKPGHVYVAPGDRHLTVRRAAGEFQCKLEAGPRVNGHIPSVDVLFESVASACGMKAIGIILTGMGRDGASGLRVMRDAGALTAGQDEHTSLIYGMPKAAFAEGAVMEQLPLEAIAPFIMRHAALPARAQLEASA